MEVKDRGFWEGGGPGRGTNKESGGQPSGYPGERKPTRTGVRIDLEYPPKNQGQEPSR